MDKRAKKEKGKNRKMKCSYSGEFVGNKEVVLTKYAKDYLRQLGYLVSNFRLVFIALFVMMLFTAPMVSAEGVLDVDLSSRINIVMIAIFFVISGLLIWLRMTVFASLMIMILGFVLLFSGFNEVLSFIIISGGTVVAFWK